MDEVKLERFEFSSGVEELLPLISAEYPEGEMADPQYLAWEYLDNPCGLPEMVVARSDSNEIVGQYVVIPLEYNIEGVTVAGSLSLNTLTHTDFRGRGLFTSMALETYTGCGTRGLEMTIGFPNMASYPGFVRKLGFTHIGNAIVLVRPLRAGALIKGAILRHKHPKYQSYRIKESYDLTDEYSVGEFNISKFDVAADADMYLSFWEKRRSLYNQTNRDPKYLEWRYSRVPTRSYTLLKVTKGSRFLGFLALRIRTVYGMKASFVIDFNCLPEDESKRAGKTLLEFSKKLMRQEGSVFMGVLVTKNCPEFEILRKAGFFKAPSRFLPHDAPIILRWNRDSRSAESMQINRWFLTFGDYDAF